MDIELERTPHRTPTCKSLEASWDANLGQSRISAFGLSLHAEGKIFLAFNVFRSENIISLSVERKASYLRL